MARTFSLLRRKPELVDLTIPKQTGVASLNFYAAPNFDEPFVFFANVPSGGRLGSGVYNFEYPDNRYKGTTRFYWNPDIYGPIATLNSVILIANALRADYEAHRVDDSAVHNVHTDADITNTITAPAATFGDLASLITLANDLATTYELHRVFLGAGPPIIHNAADNVNVIVAPVATDFASAQALILDIQAKFSGHRAVPAPAVHNVADTFNGSAASLSVAGVLNDGTDWWIRVSEVDFAGVEGPLGAPQLLLPYSSQTNRSVVIEGTVLNASSLATSQELQLPMQCNDWGLVNSGGSTLAVAFDPSGPEMIFTLPMTQEHRRIYTKVTQLFVRGVGGNTTIRAQFTQFDNPNQ
jgi:hypothetical protein